MTHLLFIRTSWKMSTNNTFGAETLTGNPTWNSRHVLASRSLNMSCSCGQSTHSIENGCVILVTQIVWSCVIVPFSSVDEWRRRFILSITVYEINISPLQMITIPRLSSAHYTSVRYYCGVYDSCKQLNALGYENHIHLFHITLSHHHQYAEIEA